MSDHDEVRELLELASVEPGGLDRLEAGDTPEAVLVVGHVAGCPTCLEEMARLRRAETLLRPILAAQPDPALRERTLAFVRAVGVARTGQPAASERLPAAAPALAPAPAPAGAADARPTSIEEPGDATRDRPGRRRTIGIPAWAGTLAAALVIGLLGGALLVGSGDAGDADAGAALEAVALETAVLYAAGDAREVVLVDAAGEPAGTLVLSPSAGRMLVTATGLAEPGDGREYRCWVAVADARTTIGTMEWADGVGWWAGDVTIPTGLPPGAIYGVSLVDEGSPDPGTELLTGAP
jgi:hypothetical protein